MKKLLLLLYFTIGGMAAYTIGLVFSNNEKERVPFELDGTRNYDIEFAGIHIGDTTSIDSIDYWLWGVDGIIIFDKNEINVVENISFQSIRKIDLWHRFMFFDALESHYNLRSHYIPDNTLEWQYAEDYGGGVAIFYGEEIYLGYYSDYYNGWFKQVLFNIYNNRIGS